MLCQRNLKLKVHWESGFYDEPCLDLEFVSLGGENIEGLKVNESALTVLVNHLTELVLSQKQPITTNLPIDCSMELELVNVAGEWGLNIDFYFNNELVELPMHQVDSLLLEQIVYSDE